MRLAYICMDPNVSLSTTHRAPTIHIAATIANLERLGHHVTPFLYGDSMRPAEAALRSRTDGGRTRGGARRYVRRAVSDLLLAYQDVARDRELIRPILSGRDLEGVYERLYRPKTAVTRVAQELELPILVESNAPAEEREKYWGSPLDRWIRRREAGTLERASAVVVVSTPLRDYFVRQGIPEEKLRVLPNGVDEERFSPESVARDVRSELRLGDAVVIGFVGNIHPYHGADLFVPIARDLRRSRPDVRYLIVGGGPELEALSAALEAEELSARFSMTGFVPHEEVQDYIAAMDICILPDSNWYGSAIKLLEYAAMQKAIVAPDIGTVTDVFTHGENALLFNQEDITALIEALHELTGSSSLRSELGRNAKQHVLANHTWKRNAERIVGFFEDLQR